MSFEYRVRWKRHGLNPKSKYYQSLSKAKKFTILFGEEPWKYFGKQPDDWYHEPETEMETGMVINKGSTYREVLCDQDTPEVEWFLIERRKIGEWENEK